MPDASVILVHSPLVGPATWRAVAGELTAAGWPAVVPDLTPALAGDGPYQPGLTRLLASHADPTGGPVLLVGHSGAGPLLPGFAAALPAPVRALVYVDAGLPHPGRSWWETAPPELVTHLEGLCDGDRLPPWHAWFGPGTLARLLPDPAVRDRFRAELAPVPISYFHERTPPEGWPGPAGYLLLSDAYRDEAQRAAARGMPVHEHLTDHLAPVHSPGPVAAALVRLLTTVAATVNRPAP